MVAGTGAPLALAPVMAPVAWPWSRTDSLLKGLFGPMDILLFLVPCLACGFSGSGFGVLSTTFGSGRAPVRKGVLWGSLISGVIFSLLELGAVGPFSLAGSVLVLSALLLPGALAGGLSAYLISKGDHGTA